MEDLSWLGSGRHMAHLLLCAGTGLGKMPGSSQLQQISVTVEPDEEPPVNSTTRLETVIIPPRTHRAVEKNLLPSFWRHKDYLQCR